MEVVRKDCDISGTWRILATIDETESVFLKWGKEEPDIKDQKVIDWAQGHVDNLVQTRQEMQALAIEEPTVEELKAQIEAQAKIIEEKDAAIKTLEVTLSSKEAELKAKG